MFAVDNQLDVIDVNPDQAKRSAKHWHEQWSFLAKRESIMLLGKVTI